MFALAGSGFSSFSPTNASKMVKCSMFPQNIGTVIYFCVLTMLLIFVADIKAIGEVIYAVNCGGESHTDVHGVRYQKDPHTSMGISSDYGKNLMIQRVTPQDQILYQTERYDTRTFGYDVPIKRDGQYVLVLKFSEVWFTAPHQKVTLFKILNLDA